MATIRTFKIPEASDYTPSKVLTEPGLLLLDDTDNGEMVLKISDGGSQIQNLPIIRPQTWRVLS